MAPLRIPSQAHASRQLTLSDRLAILGIFILFSIPSLKLLYSSEIVNAIPISILAGALLLNFKRTLPSAAIPSLVVWLVFSTVLLLTGLMDAGDARTVVQYAYHIIAVFLVILTANHGVMIGVGKLILAWGLFIAAWQLSVGIPTERELGQHYLTVAMPIGAALAFAAVSFLLPNRKKWRRVGWLVITMILLGALSTTPARAALLFSFGSAAIVGIVYLLLAPMRIGKRLSIAAGWLVVGFLMAIPALQYLNLQQIDRLRRLLINWEEEPRIRKYLEAFDYISVRPIFGHGFGSSERLFGNHPHNIFLEIVTHGGVILLSIFMLIMLLFINELLRTINRQEKSEYKLRFLAIALFFFLQWNVSFPFAGAYVPIACLFLFLIGSHFDQDIRGVKSITKYHTIPRNHPYPNN